MLRFLCHWLKHPGAMLSMDGEFAVTDCPLCGVVFRSMVEGHTEADYAAVLDRWFVDWRHD